MRKLEVRLLRQDRHSADGFEVEKTMISVDGGRRVMFFVFKSDDIDNLTLHRLGTDLKTKIADPSIVPVAIAMSPDDSFEVYEVE